MISKSRIPGRRYSSSSKRLSCIPISATEAGHLMNMHASINLALELPIILFSTTSPRPIQAQEDTEYWTNSGWKTQIISLKFNKTHLGYTKNRI